MLLCGSVAMVTDGKVVKGCKNGVLMFIWEHIVIATIRVSRVEYIMNYEKKLSFFKRKKNIYGETHIFIRVSMVTKQIFQNIISEFLMDNIQILSING